MKKNLINVFFNTEDNEDWVRISPTGTNKTHNCKFFFKEADIPKNTEIDFLVVFNNYKKIKNNIYNFYNTLLLACEPPSIHNYNLDYINQFRWIVSSDKKIKHKNKIYKTTFFPWHVGINRNLKFSNKNLKFKKLYKMDFKKKKLLSIIQTNKSYCIEHDIRNEILNKLKQEFGKYIEVFGRDYNYVSDKLNALKNFSYHVCIENYFGKNFWTEKLSDPLVTRTNPIYLGCSNISDYFPKNNFFHLSKHNDEKNLILIENIIRKKSHKFLCHKERELIFTKYNILTFLDNFIKKNLSIKKKDINIFSERRKKLLFFKKKFKFI